MATASEININQSASAVDMAQAIFGDGVTVTGASYSGSSYSSGIYSGGDTITPGVTPGDTGVILSTGSVDYFTRPSGDPNKSNSISTNSGGQNGNADFNAIAGNSTYDAAYLDVTFVPDTDVMTIQFVFSSDEYPEYSNSIYNDVVGVWVNGEHVPLSVTENPAAVTEINQNENVNLYVDNTGDDYNTEMDGFTVTMTLTMPVNAGQENSIRIGIADTSDNSYDSNLLIAGDSVQTTLIAEQDDITMQTNGTRTLDVLANDINNTTGTLEVTHINGQAVTAGQTVTLATGQQITLQADGTFQIVNDADEETVSFTYGVQSVDGAGNVLQNDTGFVTIETVPCFVAGTLIRTPDGDRPVETLVEGDLVDTLDDGPQPLRWIGQRTVPAVGAMAPIRLHAGALGQHDTLWLSPQHRVMIVDRMAHLLFDADEVLVSAKDLINDQTIRRVEGGEVTYVHLLFDKHQVLWSENLMTESFLPGPQTLGAFEADIADEIMRLFPELDLSNGRDYPAARRVLRRYEAAVLLGRAA